MRPLVSSPAVQIAGFIVGGALAVIVGMATFLGLLVSWR